MKQDYIFEPVYADKLSQLTKEELIQLCQLEQNLRIKFQDRVKQLEAQKEELRQRTLWVEDQYIVIKNKLFAPSSEKSVLGKPELPKNKKTAKTKVLLPSARYPQAPIIERHVELKDLPGCGCCGSLMADSGLTEDSEYLTVIPKQYFVVKQRRHIYKCRTCHGDLKTAPSPPRIKSGSSYSDEMAIDVALSKYCDLIPAERYAAMAGREGLRDLPPHSLIESSHYLAGFMIPVYEKLRESILGSRILHADETPHRMLEGDKKKHWHLWGFSNNEASYYEYHSTRSGEVASTLLKDARCEYLMSDVFSGYKKCVSDTNKYRLEMNLPRIQNIYCNAHARRKFVEAKENYPDESQLFIDLYQKIYFLESQAKSKPPDQARELREQMRPLFGDMAQRAMELAGGCSTKSSLFKALRYYLDNLQNLTTFLDQPELPIDNNQQERLLRNPVIGRKTWYGTHSKQGAKTAAILFSIVETCKLNNVNPRHYFRATVEALHQKLPIQLPHQFNAH